MFTYILKLKETNYFMHKIIIKQHHKDTLFLKFQLTYNFKSLTILSVLNIPYIRKNALKTPKTKCKLPICNEIERLILSFL